MTISKSESRKPFLSDIYARAKSGRCFNGAQRDQGAVVHAVPDADPISWEPALCGTQPGYRGNGWKDPIIDGEITCIRCLKKVSHQERG